MRGPVLIRSWTEAWTPGPWIQTAFVDGVFVVPKHHALAALMLGNPNEWPMFTIQSTMQFQWKPYTAKRLRDSGAWQIECEPWIDGLRASILPDAKFLEAVEAGLIA